MKYDMVGKNSEKRATTEDMAQVPSNLAKGWVWVTLPVLSDLSRLPLLDGGQKNICLLLLFYLFMCCRTRCHN